MNLNLYLLGPRCKFTVTSKTGIKQSKHIGGFPVSGLFLRCTNKDVIEKHHAKVYGKASVGAPPMSTSFRYTICKW